MASIAQVKARLEAILADIPDLTVLDGDERRVARMTLPAAMVRVRNATRDRASQTSGTVTRQYGILLLVAEVKNDREEDVQDAYELVYPWLVTIPDKIMKSPGLRFGAQAALVHGLGSIEDSGPITFPYKEQIYAGAGFTLPVTTVER